MRYRGNTNAGLGIVVYIIITCLVIYVATLVSPRLADAIIFKSYDFPSQFWTILTSLFAHGSILHILSNMFILYFFGTFLVALVGEKWFAAVYFLGGFAGNLLFWFLEPNGIALGASGAIYAVGGALMVLRPRQPVYMFLIPVPIPLWVSILGGFLLTFGSAGIAWQAHLGGLAFGLVSGFFFRWRELGRVF
jgi:membrane associated rhomboid family serine protease